MSFKRYLTSKLSIEKLRLTNILPTTHLPSTKRLSQAFRRHRADQLPPKVDLRPDMTPVEDQSTIGSSAANCLAGAYEYLTKKANGHNIVVSRLFIYYNARVNANNNSGSITDSGCSITDAIEALEEFGTCLESIWPYDISRVNTRANDQAYEQAESHTINKAYQINLDLNEMKSCLAQGFPFAFGLRMFTSFDNAAKNGVVSIPGVWEHHRQSNGSHALLAVGYSDRSNAFIVRNSWGEDWGDKGYCYIPYDYLTNPDLCFDLWTIRKVANDDFGREYWHFDDIVNYVNDDEADSIDSDNQINWNDYYNRPGVMDDSWNAYLKYGVLEDDSSRDDDNYVNDRYRRDRDDRDNEPFDQYHRGYINSGYSPNRNRLSSRYNRFHDEGNYYNDSDYDRFTNKDKKFLF